LGVETVFPFPAARPIAAGLLTRLASHRARAAEALEEATAARLSAVAAAEVVLTAMVVVVVVVGVCVSEAAERVCAALPVRSSLHPLGMTSLRVRVRAVKTAEEVHKLVKVVIRFVILNGSPPRK